MGQQHVQAEKKAVSVLDWTVLTGAQPVVGGQLGCYPILVRVTLNLLLSFYLSQFQEHIDRQEEG